MCVPLGSKERRAEWTGGQMGWRDQRLRAPGRFCQCAYGNLLIRVGAELVSHLCATYPNTRACGDLTYSVSAACFHAGFTDSGEEEKRQFEGGRTGGKAQDRADGDSPFTLALLCKLPQALGGWCGREFFGVSEQFTPHLFSFTT